MNTGSQRNLVDELTIREDWEYCTCVFPKVSRTFSLNTVQLEGDIFKAVLIGYMILRIADTFEDNACRSELDKIADLKDFSVIFEGNKGLAERLRLYASLRFRWEEDSDEKRLVENGDKILRCYFDMPEIYRKIIDPLAGEAVKGMIKFKKYRLKSEGKIFQLNSIEELEDYCYFVAGIVGIMLTKVFCRRSSIKAVLPELEKHQIHFGIALQLINIIKDYKKDLERGWCYIPLSVTRKYKVKPENLRNLSAARMQGILKDMSRLAITHMDSAVEYIKLLPLNEKSIRMFCIIPFLLAYSTLTKILKREGDKLSRKEVLDLLDRCPVYAASNSSLEKDYLAAKGKYFILMPGLRV